jgi:hypothetical protein
VPNLTHVRRIHLIHVILFSVYSRIIPQGIRWHSEDWITRYDMEDRNKLFMWWTSKVSMPYMSRLFYEIESLVWRKEGKIKYSCHFVLNLEWLMYVFAMYDLIFFADKYIYAYFVLINWHYVCAIIRKLKYQS